MYVRGGESPARQIRDPVTELIMTRRDEATPLAVEGVANGKLGVAAVAVLGEVWGLKAIAQEGGIAPFLRYGLDPPDLPKYCDGCNAKFSICHALDCKRGGLVTARHNELRDGVADLASRAFTPSHVRNSPLIYQGCAVMRTKVQPAGPCDSITSETSPPEATEQKGNLLIRDLWANGTDSIHDMRVVNTDAKSYRGRTPETWPRRWRHWRCPSPGPR